MWKRIDAYWMRKFSVAYLKIPTRKTGITNRILGCDIAENNPFARIFFDVVDAEMDDSLPLLVSGLASDFK